MLAVQNKPLFSRTYAGLEDFAPLPGSAYVYAQSAEERSAIDPAWANSRPGVLFVEIAEQGRDALKVRYRGAVRDVPLRSSRSISQMFDDLGCGMVYIDVTGLDHSSWAPLLRTALVKRLTTCCVYVEPREYSYHPAPIEGEIFDLSERIAGIAPLPGFAVLRSIEDDSVFVPLLGFEGTRLSYLIEHVQPNVDSTVPIIGVPGFRPEYPFHAYWGNQASLLETKAFRHVRFARANCPFALFYMLTDIADERPGVPLKIAPIGTKPHAIGAVLFCLVRGGSGHLVELVYDHPIRKPSRTKGAGQVSVYHVSSFLPTGLAA